MARAPSWLERVWVLVRERFPLGRHLVMVTAFVAANVAWATAYAPSGFALQPARVALAWIFALSFFLRLRLFDEAKDLEVDRRVNPTRPLARGALTTRDVTIAVVVLIALEAAISFQAGPWVCATAAIAIGYSLLMRMEFFASEFLRPRLTTYAVTHTAVSALLGSTVASLVLHTPLWEFAPPLLLLGLANWAFFNLFEFARKTYAATEEREGVETYSSKFGVRSAVMLALSQAVLGAGIVAIGIASSHGILRGALPALLLLLPFVASFRLVAVPTARNAKVFRATCGVYLVAAYGAMAAATLSGSP